MSKLKMLLLAFVIGLVPMQMSAWPGMPTPVLHTEGRYLKDPCGNNVVLHGLHMTASPWFNGCSYNNCTWTNYDVTGCINYFKSVLDKVTDPTQGWYCNLLRLHIDPYWSNNPGTTVTGEDDISQFNYTRFTTYVNSVFVPIIEYARSKGMYVILRPPGVCPKRMDVNDAYYNYLVKVWSYLSSLSSIKNANNVMFELANEPVEVLGTDGVWGSDTQAQYDKLKLIFQPIANMIRANGANNVIWVPGTGYQSLYRGYANNPITGANVGYAVHIYPGYWGQDNNNPSTFTANWNRNIKPVADIAPIVITETDWAPAQYNTWGVGTTGTAGQTGFGANLKALADASGNVSWNVLGPDDLIDKGSATGGIAYNNDPQACANPCYAWFKAYASTNTPASACSLVNNGIYEIELKTDPGKVLDLTNGTDANGTVIRPYKRLGTTAQQWKAIDAGNGYWRFVSMASTTNRCIDLTSANTALGTTIKLWDNYSNDAQAWQVTSIGGGYYEVLSKVAVAAGLSRGWDVPSCNMDGTVGLQLYDFFYSSCQQYKFNYIGIATKSAAVINAKEQASSSFLVYPNPSSNGDFTISLLGISSEDIQLRILNLEGKLVYEQSNLNKDYNNIHSGLTKGIYIIKISCNKYTYTQKIVVQ